ncbi:hypothetical protein B0T26DRAFT_731168 [Lasiosphaeria miniovina]|uniref:Uncharacterized protein n=1 Tax=Lasiosphaeria miniovina TaxID=1954250 RepID=A0AA39ZTK4_9PEZI|nr:uncharacterized protein B0T26DRAFT_731168 [Lasiosphaeria miniovina]KAK0703397.1 hypothetical protein B0T26DRAFT_731168 [Lasiosphaeria miniovina]
MATTNTPSSVEQRRRTSWRKRLQQGLQSPQGLVPPSLRPKLPAVTMGPSLAKFGAPVYFPPI